VTKSPLSLAHYDHVSLYEAGFKSRRADIAFFVDLAEASGGPILEYGAGAGRVTLPLVRAGIETVAVDKSPAMLGRLREYAQDLSEEERVLLTIKRGDMRRLRLDRRFPLVLATFNVVAHLPHFKDFAAFLKRVREHLSPGGQLVFDVPIPHAEEIEADPDELFVVPRFKHPDTKQWVHQTERFEYNPLTQALLVESTLRVDGFRDAVTIPLVLRQWFPKEIEAILYYEGFEKVQLWADYTKNPAVLAEDTLVYVATKARRSPK
jgi:SAM-dependent methyltransferase